MNALTNRALLLLLPFAVSSSAIAGEKSNAPDPEERQLPRRMHAAMKERPRLTVAQTGGDITGSDQRALQAAVDYVAALGGGTVEIGPGTWIMRDSLHLRPQVTMRGVREQTVLRKADAVSTPLVLDGDYGEEQITVKDAQGFAVGCGVTVWDKNSGGFHTTVARITGASGTTFSLDRPLNADCMVASGAMAATVFPVISGYDLEGCRVEGLTIDGNREHNPHLNGCRGAGIFLYRGFGTVIEDCTVRNFNGDGISFQQSNDVVVRQCTSEDNASLGFHPGSGSQRPLIEKCLARRNGEDGLFLCWRVRHGIFRDNVLESNGRFGISIGHKDTDNLLQRNGIRLNGEAGVFFRNETAAMAGHRNRLEANIIENNGVSKEVPGIRVRGETGGLDFSGNTIRDTRAGSERRQTTGNLIEEKAGTVRLESNRIEAEKPVDDRRPQDTRPVELPHEGAAAERNGNKVTLARLEALPFVENACSQRFRYDRFGNAKLRELRERYHLESVIAPGKDEFEKQLLLMDWTHRQFKKFGRPSTPAQGALEILAGIEAGHSFFCSQYAQLLVSAAASVGWIDRPLALRRHQGANKNGGSTEHSVTEIWSNQHRKWIMLDPTANMFVSKGGVPLNAWEIRQEWFHHGGKDLVFTAGGERRAYRKADLPVKLGRFEGFGELTVDPDEPDKYGFIGWIPNTDLMDAGFDYGKMFIAKDSLCDGTAWHVRPAPENPAVDPYFPLGQAALTLTFDGEAIAVGLKSMTPNFLRFEVKVDGGAWNEASGEYSWQLRPGNNRLEARTVNAFGVTGPVSTAEVVLTRPGSP